MRLRYRHWTRGEGIEGKIKKEEDFVVREIIDQKFLWTSTDDCVMKK